MVMTSANRFFNLQKENMTHKVWLLLLSVILYTLFLTLSLPYSTYGASDSSLRFIHIVLGIICGFQSYSYLFHAQTTDFYMGLPISRKKLFLVNYLNGFLCFFLPYVAQFIIFTLYTHYQSNIPWEQIIPYGGFAFIISILTFLLIYHLTIAAIYLTGNILTCISFLILLFAYYALIANGIIRSFFQVFYTTFYRNDLLEKLENYLSPLSLCRYMSASETYLDIAHDPYVLQTDGVLFATGVVVLSFLFIFQLQKKRPAESCGKVFAFGRSIPLLKWAIVLPCSLAVGAFFSTVFQIKSSLAIGMISFSLALILFHGCLEGIIQFRLKGLFHKKRGIILQGLVGLAFICTLFFYTETFNRYMPKSSSIEKVGIYLEGVDAIGTGVSFGNAFLKEERLERCLLHIEKTPAVLERIRDSQNSDFTDSYTTGTFAFYLKNDQIVYRQYALSSDTLANLDFIYQTPEYKKGINGISKIKSAKRHDFIWSNGVETLQLSLTESERADLLRIYQTEFTTLSLSDLKNKLPLGQLTVKDSRNKSRGFIYDSFVNTISFLEARGIPCSKTVGDYPISQLVRVTYEENILSQGMEQSRIQTSHKTITDELEIAQIKETLVPTDFYNQPLLYPLDTNTEFTVQIKSMDGNSLTEIKCYQ